MAIISNVTEPNRKSVEIIERNILSLLLMIFPELEQGQ